MTRIVELNYLLPDHGGLLIPDVSGPVIVMVPMDWTLL